MYAHILFRESLVLIKRRKRVLSGGCQDEEGNTSEDCEIEKFKQFVKTNISMMQEQMLHLRRNYPIASGYFTKALQISNILVGNDINHQIDAPCSYGVVPMMFESLKEVKLKEEQTYNIGRFPSTCSIDDFVNN